MRETNRALVATALILLLGACDRREEPRTTDTEQRVAETLGAMTLEQELHIVSGTAALPESDPARSDKVPGAAGYTRALPELEIPALTLADGPAGLRISPIRAGDDERYYATAFPIATLLASTWDLDLVTQVGAAMGDEVREYGVDLLLGPAMNIHRTPLGGRNFEYYSEDPYLSGHVGAAMVDGIQSAGVGATIKHFAANNQETNRPLLDTIVSERALREIYLRGYEIAVKRSRPRAIMAAYNRINGTYSTQSRDLLTTILRDEWGYGGLVMTDWFAGNDGVAQILAGNDLLMPGSAPQAAGIAEGLRDGRLDEAALRRSAGRVLRTVLEAPALRGYRYGNAPDLRTHAELARHAAAQGVVLLKNEDSALPLSPGSTIAAFGNASYDFISGGTGSGDVNEAYTVSLVQGLETAGFGVDDALERDYTAYIEEAKAGQPETTIFDAPPRTAEMSVSASTIEERSRDASVATVTIGRRSGEFRDREVEDDFDLTRAERSLLAAVSRVFHARGKPVVVILNVGNVIETASWRDLADAIVLAWQGGQEAGNAVVDVLAGRVNPSGRLPTTFPVRYADVPSARNFPGEYTSQEPVTGWSRFSTGRPSEVVYEEGIYVGYRYFTTFDVPTAFEFGFGLSYTDFAYGELVLGTPEFDRSITASVPVTNVGAVGGREVAQLYLSAPRARLWKPTIELKGFAKTRMLQPGETQMLEFTLDERALASFDTERAAWIADAGEYSIAIGSSSLDIRSSARFSLPRELVVEQTHRALTPPRPIAELHP